MKKPDFKRILLAWNQEKNLRQMPWKGETDPYKIWLSEIILQQTRVEQGLKYYESFIYHFPALCDLARAADAKVFKLWEGLGYYSRCKNLLATARLVCKEMKGVFPNTYETILQLKGVGPYTAAAIASFAYNLPHAVVDGNVFRVLARVFGIATPTDSVAGKKEFTALAEELLDKKQPAIYNQAIMDFGATVCKPQNPACATCPFAKKCYAFQNSQTAALPVKEKTIAVKKRWFYYFICSNHKEVFIRQRPAGDVWENLHDFVLAETEGPVTVNAAFIKKSLAAQGIRAGFTVTETSAIYRQKLTHQHLEAVFLRVTLSAAAPKAPFFAVALKKLDSYAFPGLINDYLRTQWRQPVLFSAGS
jgi:A/G-specific adenine glycosylase